MAFQATVYRILVGGPSDVLQYRKIATEVILKWNHDHADDGIVLLPGLWEDDTRPQRGGHPQSIVNRQLVDRCDAMIAIFSRRLGSPTPTHESGTVEELERVHMAGKEVMVYFYGGLVDQALFEDEDYAKLQQYKSQFRKDNLVYSFASEQNLTTSLETHLNKLVRDIAVRDEALSKADQTEEGENRGAPGIDESDDEDDFDVRDPFEGFLLKLERTPFDRAVAEQALAEYGALPVTESDKHRAELFFRLAVLRSGDTSMLTELRALAHEEGKHEDNARRSYLILGMAYDHLDNFRKSAEAYEQALALATESEPRALCISCLADALYHQGKSEEAIRLVESSLAATADDAALHILYECLAAIYLQLGRHVEEGLALQQAIQYAPGRTDLYFRAARAFDAAELHELSLLHYRTLIGISPNDDAALNNVGVAYANMDLDMLSVDSYRHSYELGNTLAGANLAYKLLNAGFAMETSSLLDEARSHPSPHRNVFEAIAAIGSKRDRESETENELLKRGHMLREFLDAYAARFFETGSERFELAGSWRTDAGELMTIEQSGMSIAGYWTNGKNQFSLHGEVYKSTAVLGEIKSKPEDASSWASTTHASRGYLYLTDDGNTAQILGVNDPKSHSSLYRKTLWRERG